MVNFTLNGSIRTEFGSAGASRLRKSGFIPAIIYGEKENTFISVIKKDFDKEYLKGGIGVRIIELNIDNKKQNVLAYQIDLDPLSDLPRHIDFVSIDGKNEVKTSVPIRYVDAGKSPGIKKGGFLNVLKRNLQLFVNPKEIPQFIEINVGALHIGSKIKINDVKLPDGVRPVGKENFNICSITGRGKSDLDTSATAGSGDASTTAAAAAPASDTKDAAKTDAKTVKK
ncbi:MAG: 50S ribosomal protein L25/general stress protein Ctc [Rickettsiales bacterium]|jgi:large subunit ribosomal protein L25|nr:50S ribosomal protein L25/general stress protein Ctc [Rickettsiales bacterium]